MVLLFYLPLDLIVWNEFVRLAQFERGQNQAGVLFEHLTGVLLVQYQVPIRCVESVAKISYVLGGLTAVTLLLFMFGDLV